LAFLLALFAIVLQVSPGTEIEVPPSLVRHESNRFQAIGTTLHICAFCFVSRPRRRFETFLLLSYAPSLPPHSKRLGLLAPVLASRRCKPPRTAICRKTNLNVYISNDLAQHAQETGPPPREAEKSRADARCNALRARHKTRIARTRILSPTWQVWLRLSITKSGAFCL